MTQSVEQSAARSGRTILLIGAVIAATAFSVGAIAQEKQGSGIKRNVSVSAPETGISPAANTVVGNARLLIPDGTATFQSMSPGETRWFYFGSEEGKTYTIEAINPYGDSNFNAVSLGVFDSDGVSAAPETTTNCGLASTAPAIEGLPGSDGARCVIRMFRPTSITTLNKRAIYVSVFSNNANAFQIRIRESTLYGRWTTNGYDFHVEVQNTTTDSILIELDFYPGTGTTPPTGTTFSTCLTIPPMGAAKYVRPNGSTVNGDNKGSLRVHSCLEEFVAGSVVVNNYAYNPVTNQFIPFAAPQPINGGNSSNSW